MRGHDEGRSTTSRRLRANQTDAEEKLWYALRSRQLCGLKFVRQQPIGRYTCDFVCREKRIVIEVDGGQHAESKQDAVRDRYLHEQGYRVFRYWNNDVLSNLQACSKRSQAKSRIREWATAAKAVPCPSPARLRRATSPRTCGERLRKRS
jgi:very-short-patch-repair endonuclease